MTIAALSAENARLKALLAQTQATLAEVEEARRRLEVIVGELRRDKFGAKSEKLSADQCNLPLEDVEIAQGILDAAQEKAKAAIKGKPAGDASARNRNRGQLPAHLPRVERVIEPDSTLCPCGCGEMSKIGEDVSERLDLIPAQLRVLVTRRPKYACRRCSAAIAQAHAPEHVVPGGLPTEAMIAQVIVGKFGDHLPFYRQADIYARQGIRLDRATLGNWAGRACFHLQPIAAHMRQHLAAADRLFMDETTAPVLDPGRRQTKKGFFWAIASDDRGHGGTSPPIVLFRYAPGRGGAFAEQFLQGFGGQLLQCDGYDGYDRLTRIERPQGPWTLVHCWSHLRRRFVKLMRNTKSPIAEAAVRQTSCPCCQAAMHEIGADESQRLDVVPAQYRVIVTRRPRFACRACAGSVIQAPAPERLIKGGLPTERLVAHVLAAKYAWHLPLYRQSQMMATQGLAIDRSTLAFWVVYAGAEFAPIYERLKANLLASSKILVDETTAPVLDPGRGRTKTGYFWAIARDDRPWLGPEPPGVAYTYAPGRGAIHALKLLEGYAGIVQCDGYTAYKTLVDPAKEKNCAERITLAFCWSHLRRRFVDIERRGSAPTAKEALQRIAQLYVIERSMRGRPADERWAGRQAHSKALALALKAWFEQQLTILSGKSLTAEAIRYGLNHWEGLTRFLDDGRIEMDTNAVERAMRPICLNRKNALFAGCDEGAQTWACVASLIETCRLNAVDPEAWLADVLEKLVGGWPMAGIDDLMPWAPAFRKAGAVEQERSAA